MEILGIYAIRDIKSERYDTPYFAISEIFAKRRFLLMVDEEPSVLSKWRNEFELHKLGDVNIITGKVIHVEIQVILSGNEIKKGE